MDMETEARREKERERRWDHRVGSFSYRNKSLQVYTTTSYQQHLPILVLLFYFDTISYIMFKPYFLILLELLAEVTVSMSKKSKEK